MLRQIFVEVGPLIGAALTLVGWVTAFVFIEDSSPVPSSERDPYWRQLSLNVVYGCVLGGIVFLALRKLVEVIS